MFANISEIAGNIRYIDMFDFGCQRWVDRQGGFIGTFMYVTGGVDFSCLVDW